MKEDVIGPGQAAAKFSAKNPFFCCVISHTATSETPGLTVAGANPELVKYTSPADAEFLHYGYCKCIPGVPATPDGKPTPAVITKAALELAEIPFLIVEAGTKVKPDIPCVSFGLRPGGDIARENAMDISDVKRALEYGHALGRQLARSSDLMIIGESIPGGTTTALAVLSALGIDALFKVSSSMPENPHGLKNRVVQSALERARISAGGVPALEAVSMVGDPMMPSVAGIAAGALEAGTRVMLAGGTQMTAVLAVMKGLSIPLDNNVCIGTTVYVARDSSADLAGLVKQVSPKVPVLACDLHLEESKKPGLQAFAKGFVKEGVGAGGSSIAAMLKTRAGGKKRRILAAIESVYERSIEKKPT
ncbi:MAG: nicotinate mononucleotide-dependent phosphoribosyltransferase CobT [Nitrososphaera sp.]